jgi:hypothetical protein
MHKNHVCQDVDSGYCKHSNHRLGHKSLCARWVRKQKNTELELNSKQQKFRAEIPADFTQVVHVRAMIIGLTSDSIMTAARSS